MVWFMVIVNLGVVLYGGALILEYVSLVGNIRPRIAYFNQRAQEHEYEAQKEEIWIERLQERISAVRETIPGLRQGTIDLRLKLRSEMDRKRRLESASFKKRARDLRSRKKQIQ